MGVGLEGHRRDQSGDEVEYRSIGSRGQHTPERPQWTWFKGVGSY